MANDQKKALFCTGSGRELKRENGIYREDFVRIQKKSRRRRNFSPLARELLPNADKTQNMAALAYA